MNMSAREIKWAVGGFLGGFLLCYLLIGVFQSQPVSPDLLTSPELLTNAAPGTVWPFGPLAPAVLATNGQPTVIELPPRWVEQPTGMAVTPPPGYSLDLIDTHYQLPQPAEKQ